jgi:recombinational DNA repair ATPase RecF
VKLRRLQLVDFRGAPGALSRKFKNNNYFVYAENGRGKSTIADAIEFSINGDLARFHREGCTLGSAIHVDADEATVAVKLDDGRELTRTLKGDEPSPLGTDDGGAIELPPLPILRHATIENFMDKTGGEKREALLQILDLDALNGFRSTLRKAEGVAKDKRNVVRARTEEESATLESMREGEDLLDHARALAKTAQIDGPISSEEDLGRLELRLPPAQPDRLGPVNELVKALAEWREEDPLKAWNEAVAREGVQREEALGALLRQGEELLAGTWDQDECPLCEAPQDRDALAASIKARATDLAESRRQLEQARVLVVARADSARRLGAALRALLAVPPSEDWPEQPAIETACERLERYEGALRKSLRELIAAPATPNLGADFPSLIPTLRAAATPKESPALAALTSLYDLREQSKRLGKRRAEQAAAESAHTAVKRMLEIADTTIKAAVEDALKPIQDLAARYFSVLMVDDIYSNIELVYSARRSGQVEFSVVFAGHQPPLSPPQRIMSESQLNALGIALLLARLKHEEQQWRTLVLDDVVNGFDAPHRQGLLRLLEDEFSDWQVIVFSHDSAFRDLAMQATGGGWTFLEIVKWTPAGGPVLGDGDPLDRLESELAGGAASSGLGGFARAALEGGLSRPLLKLGYRELRYDPKGRFSAHEFLTGLRGGLKHANSPLAKLDLFDRMGGANYMATTLVHHRDGAPEPTRDDLMRLAKDLRELERELVCDQCGKPVWHLANDNSRQCACGVLKA